MTDKKKPTRGGTKLDVHSMGQSLVNKFNFTKSELPEWTEPTLKIIDANSK